MTLAAFIGDSLVLSHAWCANPFPTSLSARMGWTAVTAGLGGTGYLSGAPSNNFPARIATVLALNPDVIVMEGGINDVNTIEAPYDTPDTVSLAALASIQANAETMLTAFAGVKQVFVLSPFNGAAYPNGELGASVPVPASHLLHIGAAIQAAAVAHGRPYIDMLTDPWITGSGYDGHPKGDGNADVFITTDGEHQSQNGADYIGARLALAIGSHFRPTVASRAATSRSDAGARSTVNSRTAIA